MNVTGSGVTQHDGEDYTLTCTVSGGEQDANTTYQWIKGDSSLATETSASLSFFPLSQHNNSQYVCRARKSGRIVNASFDINVTGKILLRPTDWYDEIVLNFSTAIDTCHKT